MKSGETEFSGFWNDLLTQASWEKLQELGKKYSFTLIGGWAVFLWTRKQKSRDVDIIVDFETLARLRGEFDLRKNERLRKYEVKTQDFDIDVYVPFYSDLTLPPQELSKRKAVVEGITTLQPEALLVLKQNAEIERRNSAKGRKDAIDILLLLLYSGVDLRDYSKLLSLHKLERFLRELESVIKSFDERDLKFLGIGFKEFKEWKKKTLEAIKKLESG